MRRTVSATAKSMGQFDCSATLRGIVGVGAVPSAPRNAQLGSRESANAVGMAATEISGAVVGVGSRSAGVAGEVDEAGNGSSEAIVARKVVDSAATLTGGRRDRSETGLATDLSFGGQVAEYGALSDGDLSGPDLGKFEEPHDEAALGKLAHIVGYAAGELDDLADEAVEQSGQGTVEFDVGLDSEAKVVSLWGGTQAGEHFGSGTPCTRGVGSEEVQGLLLTEAGAAKGSRIAGEEGAADRAGDVRNVAGAFGPEPLKDASELVIGRHSLSDEAVAATNKDTELQDAFVLEPKVAQARAVGSSDACNHFGRNSAEPREQADRSLFSASTARLGQVTLRHVVFDRHVTHGGSQCSPSSDREPQPLPRALGLADATPLYTG